MWSYLKGWSQRKKRHNSNIEPSKYKEISVTSEHSGQSKKAMKSKISTQISLCCALSPPVVSDSEAPWAVAHQAPLLMGILQARILEWAATSSSRRSSQPRDWTQISCIVGGFLTVWATWEVQSPRILEWVACLFSRGSSLPRNRTRVSCIADSLPTELPGKSPGLALILFDFSKEWNHVSQCGIKPFSTLQFIRSNWRTCYNRIPGPHPQSFWLVSLGCCCY